MNKSCIICWAILMALAAMPLCGHALPSSHFAHASKLSQGHWVKIAVTESGVYQITLDQLREMGFSTPSNIQVYGYGGQMMSEVLSDNLPDDLNQVPVLRLNDKICFYAIGNVSLSLGDASQPRYSRTRNTYSQKIYYFLTEGSNGNISPTSVPYQAPATPRTIDTSLRALLHEQEKTSVSFTGSELLGEDLNYANNDLSFTLVNPSDKTIGVTSRVAAKIVRKKAGSNITVSGAFNCNLHIDGMTIPVPYSTTAQAITGSTAEHTFYQLSNAPEQNMVWVNLPDTCHTAALSYGLTLKPNEEEAVSHLFRLDYFMITYNQFNRMAGNSDSQLTMGLAQTDANNVVRIEGNNLVVWDITDPTSPQQMQTRTVSNHVQFTPGQQGSPKQYVAFNPSGNLHQIDDYKVVENQNLHGMAVPDMVILTHHEFIAQAERVAQLHRQQDQMDVVVLDQDKVFNEFSSGTPNAMAIRLLCKMLYDRNPSKFKYLLLFGNLSFDNRGIVTGKQNRIISYVSSASYKEDVSYFNDDFYGYLDDESGQRLASDRLRIGIGHMPVANATEATQAVDKLEEYVYSTDYGPWRNNYCLWAENSAFKEEGKIEMDIVTINAQGDTIKTHYKDFQMHESQAAGIGYIIDNESNAQMVRDMAFVRMFPQSLSDSFIEIEKRPSTEAKRHILETFNEGQYFATYVGHAGATNISATKLWTSTDVQNYSYARLPIMTTACCDVARFDSDSRGICELMFHKRDGGAIALFTTTRQVLATMNDDMNRAFTQKMFSYNKTGVMPRLGDAYLAAKNYYSSANTNKFNWVLLGDPALKVNYPKPLFKITSINSIKLSSGKTISTSPLQQLTIEAQVMKEGQPDQVNTAFNGDATISIYDSERVFMKYIKGTGTHSRDTMSLAYPRERLVQVTGRVVNGMFRGSVVMPRFNRASYEPLLVSVYAHADGTDQMVNGMFNNLRKSNYNAQSAVTDNTSPVIQAMYLNNETEFEANATIGSQATLYIRATDNTSFNTQQLGMGRNMKLTLDGGKTSYNLAKDLAVVSNGGKQLDIALPLSGLSAGQHTLTFHVSDVCGNATSHIITFVVSSQANLSLEASDIASSSKVDIDLAAFALSEVPTVNLKVTDIHGNLVWSKQTNNFPCTWNLTDKQGHRVSNGLYRIYASYSNNQGYGGSNLINFVVLPAVNQ